MKYADIRFVYGVCDENLSAVIETLGVLQVHSWTKAS
jgi:hypothetical protein